MIGAVMVITKKLHDTEDPRTIIFYFTFFGSITYLLAGGDSFHIPTTSESIFLLGMGVCGTIGQFFFTYSYRYGTASEITPFIYSEVIFAALFGALYFKEIPDIWTVLGTMVVIGCGISILNCPQMKMTGDVVKS